MPQKQDREPSVLGLDLSLTSTGFALFDVNGGIVRVGCVRTSLRLKRSEGGRECSVEERLDLIVSELSGLWCGHLDLIAIEAELYSTHVAGLLGMVHGAVRLAAFRESDAPIVTCAPTSLKKWATGSGRAIKEDMIYAAQKSGYEGGQSDEADAWLMGKWGLEQLSKTTGKGLPTAGTRT